MKKLNVLNIKILDLIGIVLAVSLVSCVPDIISKFLVIVIFFILLIANLNKIKKSSYGNGFVLLLVIFVLINLLSNILNHGDEYWYVMQFFIIDMCFFVWLCYKYSDIGPIYVLVNTCNLWLMISFVELIIKFLSNNYDQTFLLCGYDNGFGAYSLPIIIFNLYFILNGRYNFWMILNTVLAILQIMMIWSATAIVGVFLILITFFKSLQNKQSKVFTPLKCYLAGIIVFVFVILLRTYENVLTRWLVEDVLHRAMTFSGRTYVWDSAFLYISQSLLIGHGRLEILQRSIFLGVSSAHNIYLDILCQSGIIGIIIMTILFIIIVCLCKKSRSSSQNFFICSTFLLVLSLQFESYCAYWGYPLLFLLFSFSFFVCKMDISNKVDKQAAQNECIRR